MSRWARKQSWSWTEAPVLLEQSTILSEIRAGEKLRFEVTVTMGRELGGHGNGAGAALALAPSMAPCPSHFHLQPI